MSDKVRFERDGLYAYRWNGETRQDDVTKVTEDDCLRKLRCACEIGDGVTLLDIFRAVGELPVLKDFFAQYSWCWSMDEFMAAVNEPMRLEAGDEKIEYLEVYWDFDADRFKGEVTCGLSTGFHGIGFEGIGEHRNPSDNRVHWSVSCTPLYEIADCPVRLNEDVEIRPPNNLDAGELSRDALFSATHYFTLLEVLDAIFDDISFYGGPAEAADFIEEMNETMAGIESGEIETVPFDDFRANLEGEL